MLRSSEIAVRARLGLGCLMVAVSVLVGTQAVAQTTADIVRIEQDWELSIGTPDAASNAPQITCTISPTGNIESIHAALDLNHRKVPAYSPGGLQLQVWDGESLLTEHTSPDTAMLSQADETISWTQSMELKDGQLVFEVSNGSSTTWSTFGGQGYLKTSVATTLTNLNQYQSDVSVRNSGAGFAANRVQSLVLKRVRCVLSTGETYEDTQPRTVYPSK